MPKKEETKKPVMIKWEKENGTQLFTNDKPENVAMAKKLGWKEIKPKKAAKEKDTK